MYKVALFCDIPQETMNLLPEDKYSLIKEVTSEADGIIMRSLDINNMKFSK